MAKAAYRGDPGLFGFLGGAVKAIGKVAGVLPGVGGIAGKVLGAAGGLISKGRKVVPMVSPARTVPIAAAATIPAILRGVGAGVVKAGKSIPGQIAIGTGVGLGIERLVRGGGRKRYRRMNPTNPKALKRAIRRVERFGDVARACGYSRPPKAVRGCKTPTRKKTCR